MSREVHVQFWESVRVRSPRATQLPLYRQQGIFERAGVKLPISTLADWVGVCGVRLGPLVEALRETVLSCGVLHADETPIQVLRPDTGRKTHRAYLWAYAPCQHQSTFDPLLGLSNNLELTQLDVLTW